jgi:hypothetical protein
VTVSFVLAFAFQPVWEFDQLAVSSVFELSQAFTHQGDRHDCVETFLGLNNFLSPNHYAFLLRWGFDLLLCFLESWRLALSLVRNTIFFFLELP